MGSVTELNPEVPFAIGRSGHLAFNDNPYLHRHLLRVGHVDGLWWVSNVGSRIPVRLSEPRAVLHSVLSPGDSTPLVHQRTSIVFQANETVYEVEVRLEPLATPIHHALPTVEPHHGALTIAPGAVSDEQRLLLVALAEPMLRHTGVSIGSMPSLTKVGARLGWSNAKVNRKLDYLCEKLTEAGVPGLVAGGGQLATHRRAHLVEFVLGAKIITRDDLALLDAP